jgi:hypothetical protein
VFPQDGEIDQLIDSFDELKTIVDPKSQYVTNAANAVGRGGTTRSSPRPSAPRNSAPTPTRLSSETWAISTNYVVASNFGASAASGLTVAKLIEAKRILRHNHVDLEVEPSPWSSAPSRRAIS